MTRFATRFVYMVSGMVALAVAIRITWALLQPVLVPGGVLLLVVLVVAVVLRLLWYYTAL